MSNWRDELAKLGTRVKSAVNDIEEFVTTVVNGPTVKVPDDEPASSGQVWPEPEVKSEPEPKVEPAARSGSLTEQALLLHTDSRADGESDVVRINVLLNFRSTVSSDSLCAAGLISAYQGRLDEARSLMDIVPGFERTEDVQASRIAWRWRVADAAETGDWARAWALSQRVVDDPSGEVAFFGALAAWHLRIHDAIRSPLELQQMADQMPSIAGAHALVVAATNPSGTGVPSIAAAEGALGRATAAHAHLRLMPVDVLSIADVRACGDAWDAAFSSTATQRDVASRRAELGGNQAASDVLTELRESVVEDLADRLVGSRVSLIEVADGERVGILGAVVSSLEERLVAELEMTTVALHQRLDQVLPPDVHRFSHDPLDPRQFKHQLAECKQWLALRRQFDQLGRLCGAQGRMQGFNTLSPIVRDWSVRLWNEHRAHALANAMFRWIVSVAESVGDESTAATFRDNCSW